MFFLYNFNDLILKIKKLKKNYISNKKYTLNNSKLRIGSWDLGAKLNVIH